MNNKLMRRNLNQVQEFVKKAFKDECQIPDNIDEFKKCLTNETTDGSTCFDKKFGEGENDVAMIFFYPTYCQVPIRYQENMRYDGVGKMNMLVLDYQEMLINNTPASGYDYLRELQMYMAQRFDNAIMSMSAYLYNQELLNDVGRARIRSNISRYVERYNQINTTLNNRIKLFEGYVNKPAQSGEDE